MGTIYPQIIPLESTDSTNREAFRLLGQGSPAEGTVILATRQYAGRGQGQASWESEPGKNLTFSVILRPVFLPPASQFLLNQSIALGVRDGLASLLPGGEKILIKWPNDIFWKNQKVSGTLIENQVQGNRLMLSVAGIGININQETFSVNAPLAVSLKNITGQSYELATAFRAVFEAMMKWYETLREENHPLIRASYLEHLLGLGETRNFGREGKVFSGKITGVDQFGRLLIETTAGQLARFDIRELSFLF